MPLALEILQTAVTQRIRSLNALSEVTVVSRNESDAEARIDEAIKTGFGLAVRVDYPEPERIDADLPGPVFTSIVVPVQVIENVYTNGLDTNALAVAEILAETLHLWKPRLPHWHGRLAMEERRGWRFREDRSHPDRVRIEQRYRMQGVLTRNF